MKTLTDLELDQISGQAIADEREAAREVAFRTVKAKQIGDKVNNVAEYLKYLCDIKTSDVPDELPPCPEIPDIQKDLVPLLNDLRAWIKRQSECKSRLGILGKWI